MMQFIDPDDLEGVGGYKESLFGFGKRGRSSARNFFVF
jgi:hypothetical protein